MCKTRDLIRQKQLEAKKSKEELEFKKPLKITQINKHLNPGNGQPTPWYPGFLFKGTKRSNV